MATLEVHHGRGRVEFVDLTRDQPVLFGSNPKCDIVLDDPAALPFHGRVRWKNKRFKVDASPEAQYILVNGRKMASSSVRRGDEVQVGACRMFLIDAGDEALQDEKTRIQPAPIVGVPGPASPASSRPGADFAPQLASPLERDDWLKDIEPAPPSVEEHAPAPLLRRSASSPDREPTIPPLPAADAFPRTARSTEPRRALIDRLRSLRRTEPAPGEERILTSPLVLGLVAALALLIVLGVGLKGIIDRTVATRLYQRATESLEDGDYRNAISRFDAYLASRRGDPRTMSKARVLRALANVRQFTATTGASWTNALEAERAMVDAVGGEEAYRDSSPDLDDLILRTGEALADRATASGDARALAEAESAAALHARVGGPSAGALLARSRLPAKLSEARAAVRKAAARARALAAMDAAIAARSSADAYAARDALIARYPDLAADRDLIDRLSRANDLIRRAVVFDPSRRSAETGPLPDPLGPPTSLVLRSTPAERPSRDGPLVFAVAEGFACGLDGTSGAPLWQVPVGLSSPYPPRSVPGESAAIAFDARSDELIRLDARTGSLIWRQEIGEPLADPPLILGNQVIQATPSGKVLLLDLHSGEILGAYNLGLRLARTPVSDEAGRLLYILAEKDCLFILNRDPPGCAAVEYLGHAAGSIPCTPARLGRFLVVAENHAPAVGRWRIFVLDEDGVRARPVQTLAIPGWTWDTPASSGATVWSASDRGALVPYAIGAYESKAPFRPIARLDPEAKSLGPTFAAIRSEQEVVIDSARPGRADLDPRREAIATAWSLVDAGPAAAPIQLAGPLMVLSHQHAEGPGVALWGIDPRSGSVRWRTVLGSPWPVALAAAPDGRSLDTLGIDGRALRIAPDRLAAGGFIESPLPRPGGFRLPAGPLVRLDAEGMTVVLPGSNSRRLLARAEGPEFVAVDLPSPYGATPILWGRDLLIPGVDGRVTLVDPRSGEPRAEPFAPPFDRSRPVRYRAAVRIDGDAVALAEESGRVRRLVKSDGPRPRLVVSAETTLDRPIVAGPVSTGRSIVLATADGRVRSLSSRDLSPAGAWPLGAPLAWPPAAISGRAFLTDAAGGALAIGADGQRLWSIEGGDPVIAAPPAIVGEAAWFLDRDGSLRGRSLSDGSPLDRVELGILPAGAPIALGDSLAIPAAPGTIRMFRPGTGNPRDLR